MDNPQSAHLNFFYGLLPRGKQLIPADTVVQFLKTSLLPSSVLGRIWELVNPTNRDSFDVSMFIGGCNLIAMFQQGLVNVNDLLSLTPSASLDIKAVGKASAPAQFALKGTQFETLMTASTTSKISSNQQGSMENAHTLQFKESPNFVKDIPLITEKECLKYSQAFFSLDPVNGVFLDGSRVKDFFLQSGLSMDQLKMLWNLCDSDRDGRLSMEDFSIMMHLGMLIDKRVIPGVPYSLPHSFLSQFRLLVLSQNIKEVTIISQPTQTAASVPGIPVTAIAPPNPLSQPLSLPMANTIDPATSHHKFDFGNPSYSSASFAPTPQPLDLTSVPRKSIPECPTPKSTSNLKQEIDFTRSDIQKTRMKIELLNKQIDELERKQEFEQQKASSPYFVKEFDEKLANVTAKINRESELVKSHICSLNAFLVN